MSNPQMERRSTLHSARSSTVIHRTKEDIERLKKELNIDDHLITLDSLRKRYHTNLSNGLTADEAADLLDINGPNCLIPSKPKSIWIIFAENMLGGIAILLWGGAILSLIGFTAHTIEYKDHVNYEHVYIAVCLISVATITGVFGFVEEAKNNAIMEGFSKMVPRYAYVIRDKVSQQIFAEEIVVGDLIILKAGECVPADIRIVEAQNLKVDNSSLTGESEPQTRSTDCTDKNPMETQNLAFFGTNVVEGTGKGIVIACGDATFMGHIAGLTSGVRKADSPMKKELKHFMKLLTCIALMIGTLFFVLAQILGYSIIDSFVFFTAITVANVPEGLMLTLTICLTLTAQRMLKRKVVVKSMQGIETLGSTNVICSDKTGTLTQNQMTVSHMFFNLKLFDVLDDSKPDMKSDTYNIICRVGTLCLRAFFTGNMDKTGIEKEISGDASETAVLKCMEMLNGKTNEYRALYPKVAEVPFNSTNKYQISIHRQPRESQFLLVMKGAPERIIDRCTTIIINGADVSMSSDYRKAVNAAIIQMGSMGERVLGFADLILPASYPPDFKFNVDKMNFPITGLRFCGLMSLIDPPRRGVIDAVKICKLAGIKVYMVTGDHPVTALAIARKVGLVSPMSETAYDVAVKKGVSATMLSRTEISHCSATILTGTDLKQMNEDELMQTISTYDEIVFARTSPQQKLIIVEAFQKLKNVVAVTGDGVNDSPALKRADIGIAMGITGSAVSKEAANMIILDDNFATIVTGIEEGRLVYDNLKKSTAFILTSNVPEVIPFIIYATINIPPVLSIMAILVINVGTDLWPGIALAYEHIESDIMMQKPRDPTVDNLVNFRLIAYVWQIGAIQACAGFSSYIITLAIHGFYYDKLPGLRHQWSAKYINALEDSYGQEWTYEERMILTKKCYSAFFMAIVITQVVDAIICKTRRKSLFQQGMSNWCLNCGLIFEIILAGVAVYCPVVNNFLQFEPIPWYIVAIAVPYGFVMFVFDEVRKLLMRRSPNGCVERTTYY